MAGTISSLVPTTNNMGIWMEGILSIEGQFRRRIMRLNLERKGKM